MTDSPENPQDTQPEEQSGLAPELESTLDPAQQSVADALRFTFALLKLASVIVLIFWLGSNTYSVGANETVVELRLGRIHYNSAEDPDNTGGLRWAMPYPFGDIVRIPNSTQEIRLDTEFWIIPGDQYRDRAITLDEIENLDRGPLTPGRQGSLLTGDAGLIHARWSVEYRIDEAQDYLRQVGSLELAEQIVRAAAEQSIVFNIARLQADDLIRSYVGAEGGGSQLDVIMQDINESLDGMETGLAVTKVLMRDPTLPMAVRRSYREATAVISEQAQRIEQAQQESATKLSETAGEATDELYRMITDYQNALDGGDEAEIARLEQLIDTALFGAVAEAGPRRGERVRSTGGAYGNKIISGEVAKVLTEAETYRNSIASRLNAEVATFEAYQKQVAEGGAASEALLYSKLWEAARAEILSNKQIETLYLPSGEALDVAIRRDPNVRKAQEEAALRQAEEAANR